MACRVYISYPSQVKNVRSFPSFFDNGVSKFWGINHILSGNGTEFMNKLFTDVATQMGVEYKIYTLPIIYNQMDRVGLNAFLKASISKHVSGTLEGEQVVHLLIWNKSFCQASI